jgi:hypothetical protein
MAAAWRKSCRGNAGIFIPYVHLRRKFSLNAGQAGTTSGDKSDNAHSDKTVRDVNIFGAV